MGTPNRGMALSDAAMRHKSSQIPPAEIAARVAVARPVVLHHSRDRPFCWLARPTLPSST
jgi:hypothetical protein